MVVKEWNCAYKAEGSNTMDGWILANSEREQERKFTCKCNINCKPHDSLDPCEYYPVLFLAAHFKLSYAANIYFIHDLDSS